MDLLVRGQEQDRRPITPGRSFFDEVNFVHCAGIHINTNVWHQPVYPIADEATYYGKQGAVHACVVYDSVEEHGKW